MPQEACVWYLYHSGFAVKTDSYLLVFDYYQDDPSAHGRRLTIDDLIKEMHGKKTVVFASHGHGDHFTPGILDWVQLNEDIEYFLSHDIKHGRNSEKVTVVQPGHQYHVEGLDIEALDSTDLGVAFLVSCDGLKIFHAGDLNWWHWDGEPEEENKAMAESYKMQIDLLKGKQIDLAFIPVDPRLEEHYSLGLIYFMQTVGAKRVFPMHFGSDYSVFESLKKDLPAEYLRSIVKITSLNQQFCFSK